MVDKQVQACLRCGSRSLRMGAASRDAFLPGTEDLMGTLVCTRCGHKGNPLLFESEAEAAKYEAQREGDGRQLEPPRVPEASAFQGGGARPRSGFFGAALIAIGAGLVIFAALMTFAARNLGDWGTATIMLALGIPFFVVGRRQWRAARRGPSG